MCQMHPKTLKFVFIYLTYPLLYQKKTSTSPFYATHESKPFHNSKCSKLISKIKESLLNNDLFMNNFKFCTDLLMNKIILFRIWCKLIGKMTFRSKLTQRCLLSDATSLETWPSFKCYKRESYCPHPVHVEETQVTKRRDFCTLDKKMYKELFTRNFYSLKILSPFLWATCTQKLCISFYNEKKNNRKKM